jgi:hypothetical protein
MGRKEVVMPAPQTNQPPAPMGSDPAQVVLPMSLAKSPAGMAADFTLLPELPSAATGPLRWIKSIALPAGMQERWGNVRTKARKGSPLRVGCGSQSRMAGSGLA